MTYIQIAFKEYNITKSVWEMDWSDPLFKYFGKAFSNRDFLYALRNTIFLNLLDLAVGFPAPEEPAQILPFLSSKSTFIKLLPITRFELLGTKYSFRFRVSRLYLTSPNE